jgi:hypothetical protein
MDLMNAIFIFGNGVGVFGVRSVLFLKLLNYETPVANVGRSKNET